jgi:hypothetical protein
LWLPSRAAASTALLLLATEHLLKFFKNIAETSLLSSKWISLAALAPKGITTLATEASETVERVLAPKWVLCLLIAGHPRLVVNASLSLITECFICSWDLWEFIFGWIALIDVRMVLFGQLEISLLDFVLACILAHTQLLVKVLAAIRNRWSTELSELSAH